MTLEPAETSRLRTLGIPQKKINFLPVLIRNDAVFPEMDQISL